jgi:NAD(P)-dependent dehydrogenase (short-subunit alcohol dehydrogenase family)
MKTILITGGGRGLGRVTAEKLATAGHHVILTARDPEAGRQVLADIRAAMPAAKVETRVLDLARLESVRAFSRELVASGITLDVLFHNAGVMQQSPTRRLTADGFEETLAVNVLAPFLLTALLLPALERSTSARVIGVSSRLHLPGSRGTPVRFDFDDVQLERGYDPERAYKNSKLAMLWFIYELHRRLPPRRIVANAVCPGFVPVTAAVSTRGLQRFLLSHMLPMMPFATSVDAATDSFVFMATDPSLEGVGGRFFGERRPLESSPESHDGEKAARFWHLAEVLTNVSFLPTPKPRPAAQRQNLQPR